MMLQYTVLDTVKKPFVIYKDIFKNQICLDPKQGMVDKKGFVISFPRAGNGLIENVLTTMGLHHVRITYEKNTIGDYRFLTDEDRVTFARLYDNYNFPFTETYKWITNGQFTHNHLKYDDNLYCMLRDSDFVVHLLKRDLRSIVVSHALQKRKAGILVCDDVKLMEMYVDLPYYNEILETCKTILPWYANNTFDTIEYETLTGQRNTDAQYQCIMKIMDAYEIKNMTFDTIISKSIKRSESNWEKYWSPRIDKWFTSIGFQQMNSVLGYQ